MKKKFINAIILSFIAASTQAGTPAKLEVERTTANFHTSRFLSKVRSDFDGKFKGYAVIMTGSGGHRLGFRRYGWAIDPNDTGSRGQEFHLNTEIYTLGNCTHSNTTSIPIAPYEKQFSDNPARLHILLLFPGIE